MNRDETIKLFERCEGARAAAKKAALAEGESEDEAREIAHEAAKAIWNGKWAEELLAERKVLEETGHWTAEHAGFGNLNPQNEDTRLWMSKAKVDFSNCHFLASEATPSETEFTSEMPAKELSVLTFAGYFLDMSEFHFPGKATFEKARFLTLVTFDGASFYGPTRFDEVRFSNEASFTAASFAEWTSFNNVIFSGDCLFDDVSFSDRATFVGVSIAGECLFDSASFSEDAWFQRSTFSGDASFDSATFSGDAEFVDATFSGLASFASARFSGDARFDRVSFSESFFRDAQFAKGAFFERTTFRGEARFGSAHFSNVSFFQSSKFYKLANFPHVRFDHYTRFENCSFEGHSIFYAIRGERGFSMADAHFERVPDFIQAHFEEAPRLDNVTVVARMIPAYPPLEKRKGEDGKEIEPSWREVTAHWLKRTATFPRRFTIGAWRRVQRGMAASDDLHNIPARWRALKRLAIQAHDQDREHEFFARELRSNRFLYDWPIPAPPWTLEGWFSFARFWAGTVYGLTSNYGRSILLPFLWWVAGVAVAAVFYLGEQPGMAWQRALAEHRGAVWPYATTTLEAWRQRRPCYEPRPRPTAFTPGEVSVIALSEKLRAQTSAPYEALQLALRDGFLILYGDADTAHRTYGCLYGVELYGGGTPVAIVPPQVGFWSAVHKLYSAVMIFLFGLALRNMLKMK